MVVSRPPALIRAYTAALGVVGLCAGFGALLLYGVPPQSGGLGSAIPLLAHLHALMAAACLLATGLRAFGSGHARAVTAAASFLLIPLIPLGTAVFVWWLVQVRHQEAPEPPR